MLLAVREILRSKVRFGLLSGAVGLLIFLILFQQAILGGLITDFVGAVENQNAPVLVFNEQARKNVEASFLFPEQVEAVRTVEGVAESGLIGQNTYTAEAGGEQQDAVLFGYELGGLGEPQGLVEGRLPQGPDEGVASAADAGSGFGLGDVVRIVGEGGPAITVVGRADSLRWSVAPTLFVSYDTYERAQLAVNPEARVVLPSLVALAPVAGIDAAELTALVDAGVTGVETLTRQQAVDQNPGVQAVSQSFRIILGLAFLVVTLVVGFFFLILTVQKARSLTLLRAIGSPTGYLVRNLLAQVLLVSAIGTLAGVGLTLLVIEVAPSGDLSVALDARTTAVTIGALTVLALVASAASIRRVLRIDPIEATTAAGAAA